MQGVENTFTNLGHLIGETVIILGTDVDGSTTRYDDEVVDASGAITLKDGSTYNWVNKCIVGLPYRYKLKPMRLDLNYAGGTTKGNIKRVPEVVISFLNTLGAKFGKDVDNLKTIKDFGSTLYTGDVVVNHQAGYDTEDSMLISANGPFPCTVRAIVPRMEVTGR